MKRDGIIRARTLRRDMTGCERKVWRALRGRRFVGFKFRRQVPIGPYCADFACLEARLIVEIDGRQHDADDPKERRRTAYLTAGGYRVLRFANEQVLQEFEGVLDGIEAALPDPRWEDYKE